MSEKSPSMKLVKGKKAPAKVTSDLPEDNEVVEEQEATPVAKKTLKLKKAEPIEVEAEETETETESASESIEDSAEDLIVKVASEVENMTGKKAFKTIPLLMDSIEHDYFKLGGILAKVQSEGWFMEKGYENFRGFVEAEVNMEYRKAMYFIAIYNGLVESGVAWSLVGHLGWTKLKELASLLTPENAEEWVGIAENMTVLQLIAYIKEQKKAASTEASDTDEEVKKITTMTFKLHEDQKATIREGLTKAKETMKTDVDAVALEHVMLDFLAGDKKLKKQPTLEALMKAKSAEEVLETFGKVFPDVAITATVTE